MCIRDSVELDQRTGRYVLLRGIDCQKDQSYYLGRVKADRLPWFKTPLGNLTKETTRKIAQVAGLQEVSSRESQDICFVPEQDYRQFIINFARSELGKDVQKPGPIYNTEGQKIGEHQGIVFYTIGQRKGLGISAPHPLYVIEIDPQRNAVIAGNREQILAGGLIGEEINWVSITQPPEEIEVEVQIRYRHPPANARLKPLGEDRVEIRFHQPQPAVTPGQLAVFYQKELLLGSAFISKSLRIE
ncbi:MAG: tRNA 2-thiouridine(34) synthase MnmA, partial [Candidatus Sumerlaeia bacterium]|nr:tRNA 2-thiouridine(34) synthase MnmA [Candidatus Sumerlaeia bacterium]